MLILGVKLMANTKDTWNFRKLNIGSYLNMLMKWAYYAPHQPWIW